MKIIKLVIEAVVADDADEALVKHAVENSAINNDFVKYCEVAGDAFKVKVEEPLESKPTAVLDDGTGAPVAKEEQPRPKRKYTRHVKREVMTDKVTGETIVMETRT